MPIAQRLTCYPKANLLFVDIERHSIRRHEDLEQVSRCRQQIGANGP